MVEGIRPRPESALEGKAVPAEGDGEQRLGKPPYERLRRVFERIDTDAPPKGPVVTIEQDVKIVAQQPMHTPEKTVRQILGHRGGSFHVDKPSNCFYNRGHTGRRLELGRIACSLE